MKANAGHILSPTSWKQSPCFSSSIDDDDDDEGEFTLHSK